jgi:hypothetical protein
LWHTIFADARRSAASKYRNRQDTAVEKKKRPAAGKNKMQKSTKVKQDTYSPENENLLDEEFL